MGWVRQSLGARTAQWFLVVSAAFIVLYEANRRPHYNWDMIGYVAAAYYEDGYRGRSLLKQTYSEVQSEVGADTFKNLIYGEPDRDYRNTIFLDPVALNQQIPFYSIRVLYVEAIRLLKKVGITYSRATHIISAIFATMSVVVLAMIASEVRVKLFVTPIIILSTGFIDLGRYSTPDAMACFFSLLCMLAVLKRSFISLVLAVVMPLIRTDFIILSLLIASYEFFSRWKYVSVAAAAVSLAIYFAINYLHADYGWLTIFNFSLIGITPYPAKLIASTSIMDYIRAYIRGIVGLVSQLSAALFALALFSVTATNVRSKKKAMVLVVIPLGFVLVHFALFPVYFPRFFVFAEALVLLWLFLQLEESTNQETAPRPGA